MNRPIKIDSRFATAAETARILGVSPSRLRQIVKLFDASKTERRRLLSASARRGSCFAGRTREAALAAKPIHGFSSRSATKSAGKLRGNGNSRYISVKKSTRAKASKTTG